MKKLLSLGIRGKILLFVLLGLVFFFLLETVILQSVYLNSFKKQEQENSVRDIQRAEGIINDQINNIKVKIADWAVWDDAYNFVLNPNQDFIKTNLAPSSLASIKINYMIYISSQGAVVNATGVDLASGESANVPQKLINYIDQDKSLTTHRDENDVKSGIIHISKDDQFYGFASAPIIKSNGDGPIAGTLIFARVLDSDFYKQISNLNNSKLEFFDYDSASLNPQIIAVKTDMPNGGKYKEPDGGEDLYIVNASSNKEVNAYTVIYDFKDKPAFILKDTLPREFYFLATSSINFTLIVFIGVSAASLLFAYLLLNKLVISKIMKLNKSVEEVSDPNNPTKRIEVEGADEFANLATRINTMLDRLSQSDVQLKKQRDELKQKLEELQKFQDLTVGRELKMVELKKRIEELEKGTNQ